MCQLRFLIKMSGSGQRPLHPLDGERSWPSVRPCPTYEDTTGEDSDEESVASTEHGKIVKLKLKRKSEFTEPIAHDQETLENRPEKKQRASPDVLSTTLSPSDSHEVLEHSESSARQPTVEEQTSLPDPPSSTVVDCPPSHKPAPRSSPSSKEDGSAIVYDSSDDESEFSRTDMLVIRKFFGRNFKSRKPENRTHRVGLFSSP